jgi:predicted DNA-binding transcriptional regulator AlpA
MGRLAVLPTRVAEVSPEAVPGLLGDLTALAAQLWTRLAPDALTPAEPPDELLTVEQAATRLGTTPDWLYRQAKRLPFTVRLGPRQLRFSSRGITRYIRQRQAV